jgi:hypothetical protein
MVFPFFDGIRRCRLRFAFSVNAWPALAFRRARAPLDLFVAQGRQERFRDDKKRICGAAGAPEIAASDSGKPKLDKKPRLSQKHTRTSDAAFRCKALALPKLCR